MTITYDVVLDITSEDFPHIVNIRQGAKRNTLVLHLVNCGNEINLNDCVFGITTFTHNDEQVSHNYGWYDNGVNWIIPPEATNEARDLRCQLTVTDISGTVVYSPNFLINVTESHNVQPESTVGVVDFSGIQEILVQAQSGIKEAEAYIEDLTETAVSAKNSAVASATEAVSAAAIADSSVTKASQHADRASKARSDASDYASEASSNADEAKMAKKTMEEMVGDVEATIDEIITLQELIIGGAV